MHNAFVYVLAIPLHLFFLNSTTATTRFSLMTTVVNIITIITTIIINTILTLRSLRQRCMVGSNVHDTCLPCLYCGNQTATNNVLFTVQWIAWLMPPRSGPEKLHCPISQSPQPRGPLNAVGIKTSDRRAQAGKKHIKRPQPKERDLPLASI